MGAFRAFRANAVQTNARMAYFARTPSPGARGVQARGQKASAPQSPVNFGNLPPRQRIEEPLYHPPTKVEMEVSHRAFRGALEASLPPCLRGLTGLQELCTSLLQRRRLPSSGGDALMHLFIDFDTDSDGILSSQEIAQAFQYAGVSVDADKVQELMTEFEGSTCTTMGKDDWPDFVQALATSEIHSKSQHRARLPEASSSNTSTPNA